MRRLPLRAGLLLLVFAITAAACSSSNTPSASSSSSSEGSGAPIPTAKTVSVPVTYGYYDGHVDAMLSTDVSDHSQAMTSGINYSKALLTKPAKTFPSLYQIKGTAAPNQPVVFATEGAPLVSPPEGLTR